MKNSHTPLKIEVQEQLKQISKELNRLNNPALPLEAKKFRQNLKNRLFLQNLHTSKKELMDCDDFVV